jgi:hypothetical protein
LLARPVVKKMVKSLPRNFLEDGQHMSRKGGGGGRRRLHEEFNEQASSPNIMWVIKSRGMRGAGFVARMGERRGAFRFLVGKPEGKRRSRRRWGDNIKMYLQEVAFTAWTGLICLAIWTGGGHF